LGAALAAAGMRLDVVRNWAHDPLPTSDGAGYDLVLVLGGPMSANEAALDGEAALLAASARAGRPTIGICLGAQLLARGLGAEVYRGETPELGILPIALTDAGRALPPFAALAGGPVFQWHSDTFTLPAGAALLASSPRYPHQAFAFGPRAFGIQFHPECDRAMRLEWAERGGLDGGSFGGDDALDARGRAFARALLQHVGVRVEV
jgi:GMP synthase (glutamine-hydrolysing)